MIFKKTQFILLLLILLSGFVILKAQDKKTENLCPTFKQSKIFVPQNQILVMGETHTSQFVRTRDEGQTLLESIARVGGISKKAHRKIQILKCSKDFETVEKSIFVDFRKVKYEEETDVKIEGGEIIIFRKNGKRELPKKYFEQIIMPDMADKTPKVLLPNEGKILY